MGDTSNWEFAAVVAAVTIGLFGLLFFTAISTVGSWRLFRQASRAADEAVKANMDVQALARQLQSRTSVGTPEADFRTAATELTDLRRQADHLLEQQTRLQEAVRHLVEAGVLHGGPDDQVRDLQASIKRLEENLGRVAAAVANLGARSG